MLAIAVMALASGFGQFGVVAALGDVSKQLGHVAAGSSVADKVGLSGTSLGVGLAIIRLASLGSLPLIGMADRLGRRRVILAVTVAGLAFTVAAAASPGYWWFVVIFAFGRPLLSATNALAEVMAAEETSSKDRAAAVALIAAGYGVGAGLSAIVHSLAAGALGFRGIFALAVIPLAVVVLLRRRVEEPSRFTIAEAAKEHPTPILGAVESPYRGRVALLALVGFVVSVITGPATSFLFLYAQDVVHLAGYVTALMVAGRRRHRAARAPGRALAGRPRRTAPDLLRRPGGHRGDGGRQLFGLPARPGRRVPPGRVLRLGLRTGDRLAADRALPHVGAGVGDRVVDRGRRPGGRGGPGRLRHRGRRREPLRRRGRRGVPARPRWPPRCSGPCPRPWVANPKRCGRGRRSSRWPSRSRSQLYVNVTVFDVPPAVVITTCADCVPEGGGGTVTLHVFWAGQLVGATWPSNVAMI